MNFTEYQNAAVTTLNPNLNVEQVTVSCILGLCGESGEIADLLKKVAFHKMNDYFTDDETLKLEYELGDLLWYIATLAHALGCDLDEIAHKNIHKLSQRHKGGFTRVYDSDSGDSR